MACYGKTINSCISKILRDGEFSDVVFIFKGEGQNRRLHGHKLLLALRSDVFAAMFFGLASDNKQEIEITDIDYETFRIVLQAIYTDDVFINEENVYMLLQTAHKYQLDFLLEKILNYLTNCTCINNACLVFSWSRHLDLATLSEGTLTFILINAIDIFKTEGFLSLKIEDLAFILSFDNICATEERIIEASIKWAEHYCCQNDKVLTGSSIREALGPVVYSLRIPLLSLERFSSVVVKSEVLTEKEELCLYKYLTMTKKCASDLCGFESKPRIFSSVTIKLEDIMSKPIVQDLPNRDDTSRINSFQYGSHYMYVHESGTRKRRIFQTLCIFSTKSIILNKITLTCTDTNTNNLIDLDESYDISLYCYKTFDKRINCGKNGKTENVNISIDQNKELKIECCCNDTTYNQTTSSEWREWNIWDGKSVYIKTNENMSIIQSLEMSLQNT